MGIYVGRSDSGGPMPMPGGDQWDLQPSGPYRPAPGGVMEMQPQPFMGRQIDYSGGMTLPLPALQQRWDSSSGESGAIPITPAVEIATALKEKRASKSSGKSAEKPKKQGGSSKVTSSPKSLERKRRLAEALLGQGMDTSPIASPWQGAARMANALVGGMAMRNADQQEQQGREAANVQFMNAVQGGNMDMNTLAQIMSDPWASPEQQQMAAQMFERAQPKPPSWKTITDPNTGDVYRYDENSADPQTTMMLDSPGPTPDAGVIGKMQAGFKALNDQATADGLPPLPWDEFVKRYGEFYKGGNTTTIDMKGETEYDKTRWGKEGFGGQANALDQEARAAFSTLNSLDAMEQQMNDPRFYSGWGADALADAKRLAVLFGADPNMVTSVEAFESQANKSVLDQMGGSLGTGFSNADRDFVINQVPGLLKTPEGNRAIIGIMRKTQQRKIEIAQRAREYEAQHGRIDAGFMNELTQWANDPANRLFPAQPQPPAIPQPQQGSGGYRILGVE